ncbi:MAG: AGE family epimerase/isomerase [Planctomycetes bacterium]|nr:AGE family epimerase/isomerase [Planctomycetota bacterium]
MDADRLRGLATHERASLLEDTLPFWLRHALDHEYGGFLFCLDRDGTVIDTDKGLWQHGRFTWLLATLARTIERRDEWVRAAEHGIAFLERFGFANDEGRMHFQVTRDGRPLRQRRYVFTEAFAAIAFAAWAALTGSERHAERARALLRLVDRYATEPGLIPPKVDPSTRPMKGLALPMIRIVTHQVVRECLGDEGDTRAIDACIEEIRRDFLKSDLRAVLETVGANGEVLDHFDGRLLNPGHAIEAAWFILEEARQRPDRAGELVPLGCEILDVSWERGWDETHGGLFYFRDLKGLPVQEYWHDMKFWWPHAEARIATLMAWLATGERRYAVWFEQVFRWSEDHFRDREHGEWFGYLHRDGRLSVPLKGNLWKGPFHVPRMQLVCWQLADGMASARSNRLTERDANAP